MKEIIQKLRLQNGEDSFTPTVDESIPNKLFAELHPYFAHLFQTSELQFALPDDFSAWLKRFGDGHVHLSRSAGGILYDGSAIIANTKSLARGEFPPRRAKNEAWLVLGEYSGKHWYYLCCDPTSPHFGKVADGEDTSPWDDYDALDLDFDTFAHFLHAICE